MSRYYRSSLSSMADTFENYLTDKQKSITEKLEEAYEEYDYFMKNFYASGITSIEADDKEAEKYEAKIRQLELELEYQRMQETKKANAVRLYDLSIVERELCDYTLKYIEATYDRYIANGYTAYEINNALRTHKNIKEAVADIEKRFTSEVLDRPVGRDVLDGIDYLSVYNTAVKYVADNLYRQDIQDAKPTKANKKTCLSGLTKFNLGVLAVLKWAETPTRRRLR